MATPLHPRPPRVGRRTCVATWPSRSAPTPNATTGYEVEVAKFEDWDAAGRRFDAVIAGQTWHWIDPVAGAAGFAEVYRRVDTGLPFTPWAVPALEGSARLPAAKLDALLDGMAEVIDAAGGSFTMRYATVATAAVKVGTPTGR